MLNCQYYIVYVSTFGLSILFQIYRSYEALMFSTNSRKALDVCVEFGCVNNDNILYTVNVEIFDARKFRALWTGPIIFNFRAH